MHRFSDEIEYRLSYRGFETAVTQAHIHFGARATNGGISVWLCGPTSETTPRRARRRARRARARSRARSSATDVVGPAAGQGIEPGEFEELLDAIRAGVTYANVHSVARPAGEIRAQLEDDDDGDD